MAKGLVNISNTTGRIPTGGTIGQVLKKNSDIDRDVIWGDGSQTVNGIPIGGTIGQILSKVDGTDYNVQWSDAPQSTQSSSSYVTPIFYRNVVTLSTNATTFEIGIPEFNVATDTIFIYEGGIYLSIPSEVTVTSTTATNVLGTWVAGTQLDILVIKAKYSTSGTGNISNCNVTIPITGWVANTGDYTYKVDIPVVSVVATDVLIMTIDKDSLDIAKTSNLCSTVESYDGGVTVFSKNIPSEPLYADCTIMSLATLQNLLPSGGTTGQILSKVNDSDYNVQWVDNNNTNSCENLIDKPPTLPSIWDDEFNSPTLDSKWSWVNQETATTSIVNSKLGMIITSCTLPKAIIQTAPSGSFTITAKINLNSNEVNFLQFGIAVYNSANTRMLVFGKGTRVGVRSIHITRLSIDAWNADLFLEHGIGGATIYCKMVYDGTNLICSYSLDGDFYIKVCIEPIASYVLGITHLAICGYRNNTTATEDMIGVVDWFRVTQP